MIYRTSFFLFIFFFSLNLFSADFPVKKEREYDWHWFFYEKNIDEFGEITTYRPFFLEFKRDKSLFQASLMPFFFWRYKNERKDVTKGLFGFYESDNYVHHTKKRDYDSGFFPFYYYGSGDEVDDDYFFLYPFGGTIKGKFGIDYLSPYVFPGLALFFLYPPAAIISFQTILLGSLALVPLYMNYGFKDYRAHAVLWPLIQWGESSKRKDFRILPLYSHSYKKDWYDNYTYLFFINYQHYYFKNDDKYTFFAFPFYGRKWKRSGESSAVTSLWPFFSWGYDKKRGNREYNFPWPLVQIRDCENPRVRKRIFFPFYGKYEYRNYTSTFVTPLYFNIEKKTDYFSSSYTYNFFLFWYFKRDYHKKHEYYGNSWRYFKIWPLMHVEWADSGLVSLNILSLLPFRDESGYEKLYSPFWTLFEYRRKLDGTKHLGFLFRTYYQVWNENYLKFKVPILLSYERKTEKIREFTILFEGFGFDSDKKGRYVKLFWFPIKIGKGYEDSESDDIAFEDEEIQEYSIAYEEKSDFQNYAHYSWRTF